jgi:hypothetical protein
MYALSPIHIFPPHSLITPMILGCGIALRTSDALLYISFSFFQFFVSLYIWISKAYISSNNVPRDWSEVSSPAEVAVGKVAERWSSEMTCTRRVYSLRSSQSFASFRLILVDRRYDQSGIDRALECTSRLATSAHLVLSLDQHVLGNLVELFQYFYRYV